MTLATTTTYTRVTTQALECERITNSTIIDKTTILTTITIQSLLYLMQFHCTNIMSLNVIEPAKGKYYLHRNGTIFIFSYNNSSPVIRS